MAEEVRSLAQRSAEAARNTAAMIEEAVKNAENGVSITHSVAGILNEIVEGSNRVNDLVAEIAASAREQAQGIEQINNGVAQMDSVTQSNASNSEESAASSEELRKRAELLREMISEFSLLVEEDEPPVKVTGKTRTVSAQAGKEAPLPPAGIKNKNRLVNCWEERKCGHELTCPAATVKKMNRINGGTNAGRFCWVITGTLCEGKVQGTFAQKLKKCMKCDFLIRVKKEQGADFVFKNEETVNSAKPEGGNGKSRPRPERLIPLDDSDFKDF